MTGRAFIGTNPEAFRVVRHSLASPRNSLVECEHPIGRDLTLKLPVFKVARASSIPRDRIPQHPERGR